MSLRYKGARISATPPTTTGGESGVASGAWTLEQQLQAQGANNWPEPFVVKYVEDVFSTWLYTGNGSTQTITNGIDLSGKGGLVWTKNRSNVNGHALIDTVRGGSYYLQSNFTGAQDPAGATTFNADGYSLGSANGRWNAASPETYVSWTFREQAKFFDIVTFSTGATLSSDRSISHNLGSAPGFIIVKSTSNTSNWICYHRSLGQSSYVALQSTNGENTTSQWWTATAPTSTTFNIDETLLLNTNRDYVVYLFAHNAGGFGLTGTDNVISCGTFTVDGSGGASVSLGYEPQWLLTKRVNSTGNWIVTDTMRGWSYSNGLALRPNTSDAENDNWLTYNQPNATGFTIGAGALGAGDVYIYIAIRRGPMKVPTDATKVFSNNLETTSTNPQTLTTGFPVDLSISTLNTGAANRYAIDRLRGPSNALLTDTTGSAFSSPGLNLQNNTALIDAGFWNTNGAIYWNFGRAPSFFDEVCYTGTGPSSQTLNHNLGVAPALMIIKCRSTTGLAWTVYAQPIWGTGIGGFSGFDLLQLNNNGNAGGNNKQINETAPTSSVFSVGYSGTTYSNTNQSGETYVAYLFATCTGVSKIGSYTGTGATQTINCGFTGGARFVLVKRADSNGDWYVWDTARGMVSGTDPSLLLNSTAAEVNANSIYTATTGFQIVSTAAGINASGGTYIFLAIA